MYTRGMKSVLANDLELLETALRSLLQTMKRPSTWNYITEKAGINLDRPAAAILHTLVAHGPKPYHLHELARQLAIEAPSVTRKVQQLEQAGLLERQQDPEDRRAYLVRVTDAGQEIARLLREVQRQAMAQVLESWPAADRQLFSELFTRFSQEMGNYYQQSPLT